MLTINPETVCLIVNKLHEFQIQEQVEFPDDDMNLSDDWAEQTLAGHQNDVIYQELKSIIGDLEPDQQISLVALMWVGRGDFSADEWESSLATAQDNWNERTADYLIATPLVSDYLEEGLSQLGYTCE